MRIGRPVKCLHQAIVIAFRGFFETGEKFGELVEVVEILDDAVRNDLDALHTRFDVGINAAIFRIVLAITDCR